MSLRDELIALACVFLLATPVARAHQEPNGLAYEPDAMIAAKDGTILILHAQNKSVYRWSPAAGRYTQSIELQDKPEWFTYAPDTNRIYVAYDDGEVTVLDLDDDDEDHFIEMPRSVRGLAMVDSLLFVVDSSGRGETHYIFDQSGQFLSLLDRNDDSSEYIWNPHNRKMYYFDDRSKPRAFQWEDIDVVGVFGARMETSRDYRQESIPPLRLSQDGLLALLGSGVIFDSLTLQPVGSLPQAIVDAYWRADGSIAAIVDAGDEQLLQVYDQNDQLASSVSFPTTYARLVPVGDDVYMVWSLDGVPQFVLWNFATGDLDGDGVIDTDDAFPRDPEEWEDTDGDGVGNNADTDDDNDGVLDADDAFPLDSTETVDTDGDGIGNNADVDDDNDGVIDGNDAFPLDPTETKDSDNDGIGDNADKDGDNDGVEDDIDAFPNDPNESADTDSDGIGNTADTDDDNDGMPDTFENQFGLRPLDSTDANQDLDGDGATNLEEFNAGTDPTSKPPSQNLLTDTGGGGSMSIQAAVLLIFTLIATGLRRRG